MVAPSGDTPEVTAAANVVIQALTSNNNMLPQGAAQLATLISKVKKCFRNHGASLKITKDYAWCIIWSLTTAYLHQPAAIPPSPLNFWTDSENLVNGILQHLQNHQQLHPASASASASSVWPANVFITKPWFAENCGSCQGSGLMNQERCQEEGYADAAIAMHASLYAPWHLQRLVDEHGRLPTTPTLYPGVYVNENNGPNNEWTNWFYVSLVLQELLMFCETNNMRRWLSTHQTMYIYFFEYGSPEYATFDQALGPDDVNDLNFWNGRSHRQKGFSPSSCLKLYWPEGQQFPLLQKISLSTKDPTDMSDLDSEESSGSAADHQQQQQRSTYPPVPLPRENEPLFGGAVLEESVYAARFKALF